MGAAIVEAGNHRYRHQGSSSSSSSSSSSKNSPQQRQLAVAQQHVHQRGMSGFALDDGDDDVYDTAESVSRSNYFAFETGDDAADGKEEDPLLASAAGPEAAVAWRMRRP